MLRGDNNPLKSPRSTDVVLIVFLWDSKIILKKLKKRLLIACVCNTNDIYL